MASVIDSSGEAVVGDPNGLFSVLLCEDAASVCSLSAVVGAAFGWEPATKPRVGNRPTENLDAVDKRDEREPGRRGGRLDIGLLVLPKLPLETCPLLRLFRVSLEAEVVRT